MEIFADVILPLALPRPYTYRISEGIVSAIVPGARVVAPLGSKLHTGIVIHVHTDARLIAGELKDIDEFVDNEPVIHAIQIEFWKWLSSYYMCGLGEVMNAALPPGLRLASETRLVITDSADFKTPVTGGSEQQVLEAIQSSGSLSIQDVESLLNRKSVRHIIRKLVNEGRVAVKEEIEQTYKPAILAMVSLGSEYRNEEALNLLFAKWEKDLRKQKQSDALLLYLQLTGGSLDGRIKKTELTARMGASVIKSLISKQILIEIKDEVSRFGDYDVEQNLKSLNTPQQNAYQEILAGFAMQKPVLLHGVTGSGKTEIYVKLIKETIDAGKQVLYLLPEIALTTQLIDRLRAYFGNSIGIYHSKYNYNQRTEVWYNVLRKDPDRCQVVMGARSAMFLPFSNLGLVIIDEEHESSYKQHDPSPRYHARDAALMLARQQNARVLLGSATPSLESYFNAYTGKYHYVKLSERFGGMEMPDIRIVDLRDEIRKIRMKGIFSETLIDAMKETLNRDKQIILFQNRRGFSAYLQCEECGYTPECTRCDVSMTYHKKVHLLKCHYCGSSEKPITECRACGSNRVATVGYGTERIEDETERFFPGVPIARLDLDTARTRTAFEKTLQDFGAGKTKILIGTQMVTKGLDFGNVAMVGVLNADKMLNFQDFRAHERAYQLLEQVSGRAGRTGQRGTVYIQTYQPKHIVIDRVVRHDSEGMMAHELSIRKQFHYPPYSRLIRIILTHKDFDLVSHTADALADDIRSRISEDVLGPQPPSVGRVMDKYVFHILVKLRIDNQFSIRKRVVNEAINSLKLDPYYRKVRVYADVDPV